MLQKDTSQDQNRKKKFKIFKKVMKQNGSVFVETVMWQKGSWELTEIYSMWLKDITLYLFLPDNSNKPSAPFKWVSL